MKKDTDKNLDKNLVKDKGPARRLLIGSAP